MSAEGLVVESAACLLCGASNGAPTVASGTDYEYGTTERIFSFKRCARCDHVYMDPRPAPESSAVIYPRTYFTFSGGHSGGVLGSIKDVVLRRRVRRLLAAIPSEGRVLEIGSGDGAFLNSIRKARPDLQLVASDLDFSDEQRRALDRSTIGYVDGMFESADIPGPFHLIVMNQLIEHLWDVRKSLTKIRAILAPGGRLSLSTPNLEGWDRKYFASSAWGGYYFPRHLNLFTPASLTRLLSEHGLEVVHIKQLVAPLVWVGSCHNALKMRDSRWRAVFRDRNLLALAAFTALDTAASRLGASTSNMQVIARRRDC